jgi:hypothetical protein
MTDLLEIACDAATILEGYGFVACGRRVNGVTTVDCWLRADGATHRYAFPLDASDQTGRQVADRCAAILQAQRLAQRAPSALALN